MDFCGSWTQNWPMCKHISIVLHLRGLLKGLLHAHTLSLR